MTADIEQTPTEVLDYTLDWEDRGLGDDTIASSTWEGSSDNFDISDTSFTDTTTTFWLTGGIAGVEYTITNTIVTSGDRTLQETIVFDCIAQRLI